MSECVMSEKSLTDLQLSSWRSDMDRCCPRVALLIMIVVGALGGSISERILRWDRSKSRGRKMA
mgnify:CR=1 FL=1